MTRRRKKLIAALVAASLVIIAILLLNQPPSVPATQTPPVVPELPPKLLMVPEVPFGTIAIVLACFLALLVLHRKPKIKST